MTSPAVPARPAAPTPMLDATFGRLWPEHALPARPGLVGAALGAGALAAVVLPYRLPGLGTFLVLLAVCGVIAGADGRLRTPYHLAAAALSTLLIGTVVVRDAPWLVALCLFAAAAVGAAALSEGRSVPGLLASGAAVPLAGLRGLPWLGRSLTATSHARSWAPAARTVGVSLVLVLVFGTLFASADAVFATWVAAVVPDLSPGPLVLRAFLLLAFGGLTLAGVYVALNPPQVERLALPDAAPVARRFEWLVPVGLVTAVFAVFVAAQLSVMFGGHAYLTRTTGLTYADYVHQGFGQLTVTTLLTLGVVAAAVRKAPRAGARDRLLLRGLLGVLCALTLVVVASALFRVHVYEQAYGFTRLRLLVTWFEGWLGLLVVLVMVAGVRLSGRWVPRAALLTGAAALLALAGSNPDAWIARHNVERWEQTGKADWAYLSGLSADATPVLAGLSAELRGCVHAPPPAAEDWLAWNLGRARARTAPHADELAGEKQCPSTGLR